MGSTQSNRPQKVFTQQPMFSTVLAMALCLSVCVSVGVLLQWLNVGLRKQQHTIAQGLLVAKDW